MTNKFMMAAALLSAASTLFAFDASHTLWGQALRQYNHRGLVDYRALKSHPSDLNDYLKSLSSLSPSEYNSWKKEEKIAFWVNAYNALTWKAIIDHYPIKSSFFKSAIYPKNSIRQINGVWDKLTFPVMGRKITLKHIEHGILRKEFLEPRIHMALVCAALGCPPLRGEPYVGDDLDRQLDDQARQFFSRSTHFRIDRNKSVVYFSSIFDWFGEDFVKTHSPKAGFTGKTEKEKAILNFARQYVGEADQRYLEESEYSVKFLKYDWTLNERSSR